MAGCSYLFVFNTYILIQFDTFSQQEEFTCHLKESPEKPGGLS